MAFLGDVLVVAGADFLFGEKEQPHGKPGILHSRFSVFGFRGGGD